MYRTSKFVAVILMLAVMLSPALAFTAGWTASATAEDSGMKCPPDCPMMAQCAKMLAASAVSNEDGSCCKISSGKPAPAAVPQLPVNPVQAHGIRYVVAIHQAVVAQPRDLTGTVDPVPPDVSHQAVLCTFLI